MVVKLFMNRIIGREVLALTLAKIWRVSKLATMQDFGSNVFTITFAMHAYKQKVMVGRPWLFGNSLFVLNVFEGFSQPSRINFDREEFWVQLHNLSLAYMNKDCGKQIGNSIGQVIDVDTLEDGIGWGKFLRLKIELKILQALSRGRMIRVNGDKV